MSRSRNKLDTTPIDYDEVVDSPSLRGMVSFLSVPPSGLPRLDFREPAEEPVTGTPESGVPVTGIPDSGVPGARIRVAETVREGHSLGEQALYEAIWQAAESEGEHTRVLTAGYRTLAALARLTVNNCKANLQALTAKLAIAERAGFSYTTGRTYVVYSEAEIMRRRRRAGLTHYRKTRGVVFVHPQTGIPVSGIPDSMAD
jgi:hypothetical protein